jgi:hypothetical protein
MCSSLQLFEFTSFIRLSAFRGKDLVTFYKILPIIQHSLHPMGLNPELLYKRHDFAFL